MRSFCLDDVWLSELSQILPELLIERPGLPPPGPLSQGGRKIRFYDALCHAVSADKQPVMLFFDDLQWCDEETIAWLHYLLRREQAGRLLVVGTYREEEVGPEHPLQVVRSSLYREGQLVEIGLSPLSREDAARLAEVVLKAGLTHDEQHALFDSARGNPLFVVEVMRARLSGEEAGKQGRRAAPVTPASLELPPKVFALMQYRLGRLSVPAQEVLKMAAVIGRSFEQRLLLTAGHIPEAIVGDALTELCEKRILWEKPGRTFDFYHDKLRDVALAQVGHTYRRLLSRLIAKAYETVYHDRLDEVVGELAVAYEHAGQYAEAVAYSYQASQVELSRGAYRSAERYLEKALALVSQVTDGTVSAELETKLQLSLGNVARVIQRNTVPKAGAAFTEALKISKETGDLPGRLQALFGLAQLHMTDADLTGAALYCRQCITVARQINDEPNLIRAQLLFGFISLIRGEFAAARENLEQVCSYHTGERSELAAKLAALEREDTFVMANIYLSCVLWFLGYAEQSDRKMAQAHTLAVEKGLPIDLAFVCFYRMLLSLIRHDVRSVERLADRLVSMSRQYDIGFTLIAGRVGQAYVAACREPGDTRLADVYDEHVAVYKEKVSRLSQPFFICFRARLYLAAGRHAEARAVLNEALVLTQQIDDRYTEVEVVRLQGELLALGGQESPEPVFLRALEVAQAQEAKVLQLRAAVSLCRFWRQQGRQAE